MDGGLERGFVHLMNFDGLSEGGGEGNGKAATEVFSEVMETSNDLEFTIGTTGFKRGVVSRELECLNEVDNPHGIRWGKNAHQLGIRGINGHTNRNGLSMRERVLGKYLETVTCPVAEIERTSRAELKWIASRANLVEVELCSLDDGLLQWILDPCNKFCDMGFEKEEA